MVMFSYHICVCAWSDVSNPQIITVKQNADTQRLYVSVVLNNEKYGKIDRTIERMD